jgi:hypothetical protein
MKAMHLPSFGFTSVHAEPAATASEHVLGKQTGM